MKLKPVFGLVCCFLLAKSSFSQIEVESSLETGNTPAYYIEEILLGEGIQAFNIQFHGDSLQLGEFGNGENSNLNLNEGLMLATGDVGVADTFPNETNISAFTNPLTNPLLPNYDSALTALSSPLNTFHTAVLEFDFIPTGDTVRFNYVFASEEYNIFVCTQFNDVFGFFLSGPGIPGIVNLAKVPGTNEIVAVNNINDGKAGFGIAPSPCTYNTNSCACNPQYYVNNNYPNVGDSVQYNGFTVPLEAKHEVICGDTYHIRMAIADVADGAYDSGVFLEGGSFSSTLIEVNIATVNGDSSINEGCGEAEILFSRGDASDTSITYLLFSGTATNGVDFDTIPDSLVFLPGKFDSTIVITPYADGMNEGIENFIIQAISVTACGDTFISEGALYIYDTAQLDLSGPPDTSFTCPPDSLNLWVTVNSGGPPPYSYLWNNGQTSDSISITLSPNGGIDTFIVAVQDSCMIKTFYDTVLVFKNYEDDPVLEIINDSLVNCEGDSVLLEANVEFGSVPLSYLWSNGDTTSSTLVEVSGTSQIVLFISDACGRIVSDTALLGVKIPNSFEVSFPDTSRFCIGAELFVNPGPKGGIRPYQYSWDANNPQFDDDSTLTIMINQDTTISFWISDACGREFNTAFFVDAFEVDSLSLFLPTEEGSCSGTGFTLKPQLSGGLRPYTYDWSTGDTDSVITFEASVTQTIGLTITDVCGSQIDASGLIEIPEYAPLELAVSGSTELCFGDEYIIKAYARGGAGDYRYTWISLNEPLLGETFEKIDSAEFKVISRFENTHFITVNDYCGNATTDTLNITIDPCVSIPNVITPNGDGINDAFYIESINNFDDARLTVYNRWGQKIFESKPYRNQWVPMNVSSGVYYYILTSNNFPDLRGDLTIINDHE